MKKKRPLKLIVGILCIALLLLVAAVAVILDSQSPDPILGIFRPQETEPAPVETTAATEVTADTTEETESPTVETTAPSNPGTSNPTEGTTAPTESTNPTESTTNPTEATKPTEETTAPTDGAEDPTAPSDEPTTEPTTEPVTQPVISFPYQIPEYGLTIERIAPYSGMFVEDGTNAQVENVAMLLIHNDSDTAVEYTQICLAYGEETLTFDISALPAGERLVVQESSGKSIPDGDPGSAAALVVQRATMDMSEDQVRVIDNGDNTLTIQNLTNERIPTVRVFYKYYMNDENLFVGGIAFTVRISRLGAGASVTVQPSHYTSQTSRVVMVLTYDSEV